MRTRKALILIGIALAVIGWTGSVLAVQELTFLSYFAVHNEALMREIINDFHATQDDIRVNLQIITNPGGVADQIVVRTIAGNPPDLFDLHPTFFFSFIKQGLLLDLTDILQHDPAIELHDFFPPILDSVSYNGRIWALPQRISFYMLYYNQDHFDEAGLAYPSPSWHDNQWTWDELLIAAMRLRRDDDGDGVYDRHGLALGTNIDQKFLPFLWQNGGDIFDTDYTTLTLDSPAGLQAIDYVGQAIREGAFVNGTVNHMIVEKASMVVEIPPAMVTLQQNTSFAWDAAALPSGPAGSATTIQPIPIAISSSTEKVEAAYTFFRYLMSREVSAKQSLSGIILQPRRSVVTSDAFIPTPPPVNKSVFIEAIDVTRPVPNRHVQFTPILGMINQAMVPVWQGASDAATALASIKGPIEALLAEGQ